MLRTCKTCQKEKEIIEFVKSDIGFRNKCKECKNKERRTGKPNTGRFQKGHTPWTKGKPRSDETRKKISKANKGNP